MRRISADGADTRQVRQRLGTELVLMKRMKKCLQWIMSRRVPPTSEPHASQITKIAVHYLSWSVGRLVGCTSKSLAARRQESKGDIAPCMRVMECPHWILWNDICSFINVYTDGLKSGLVLLSNSQAGQGRKFSQPRDHFLAHICTLQVRLVNSN